MYIYIKEAKNDEELIKRADISKCLKNIIIKLKKIFNITTIKIIDKSHYLYIIPKINNIKKIKKIITKNSKEKIVLSKELKQYEKQLNLKDKTNINVYFLYDILEYIMNRINMKIELQNLYILVNEYNEKNLQIIKFFVDKVKTVNVVTNNIKKYHILEEKLYKEGILITVTNNRNKALKRAEIIINLDFKNEDIYNYKINRNAIIINSINEKIDIIYFQGIIVNSIDIIIKKKDEYALLFEEFDKIDIYNSFEINSKKYIENVNKIKKDKIKIKNLIGNNGTINIKENLNLWKNIDKS